MKLLDRTTPSPTNATKPPRVSFATSPDKTIDTTPPSSPEHRETESARDEDEDDFLRSKPSKPLSSLRVNKILCRVPSHESNISDLSASLSPSYAKAKPTGGDENPIYALLNVCGMADDFTDLISDSHSAKKRRGYGSNDIRVGRPNVWGLAPSMEGEEESSDEGCASPVDSSMNVSNSMDVSSSMEYDNVELVLDESALAPPEVEEAVGRSPGRRSPMSGAGMFKRKVTGIVKSGKYSSPKNEPVAEAAAPAVIISPQEATPKAESPVDQKICAQDVNKSLDQQNDDMLRQTETPVDQIVKDELLLAATKAAAAAVITRDASEKPSSRRSSPVDSITGEVNQKTAAETDKVEKLEEAEKEESETKEKEVKKSKKKPKSNTSASSKTSLLSKMSRTSAASEKSKTSALSEKSKATVATEKSKATVASEKPPSPAETEVKETKKTRSKSMPPPTQPSRSKFSIGLPSFGKRSKSVAKKSKKDDADTNEDEQKDASLDTSADNTEPSKKNFFSRNNKPSTIPEITEPTPETPSQEVIDNAKYWKATLDKNSNLTYYYHSKTKVTTWDKPPGFDEAQKIKVNNKWKATVDATTGKTYYYHCKTKEVRWTKPEGFVERKKKDGNNDGNTIGSTTVGGGAGKDLEEKNQASDANAEKRKTPSPAVNPATAKLDMPPATKPDSPAINQEAAPTKSSSPRASPLNALDQNNADQASKPTKDNSPSRKFEPKEEDAASQPSAMKRVQSIEDAPFDEPTPARHKREDSPENITDDDTFGSLPSMTKEVNHVDMSKPIDFTNRTKTFMSQLTDKTPRFNNTQRAKDFTNTQIDVNMIADAIAYSEEVNLSPSSIYSAEASSAIQSSKPSGFRMCQMDAVTNPCATTSKSMEASDDEESAVFDDWSDEVSELSGIGNEKKAVMRKLLIGRNAMKSVKSSRDSRSGKFSPRNRPTHQAAYRNERDKRYSQRELDNFIAKDDWGSVSKYISEMRNNKVKEVERNQPSPRQIQEAIKRNRRMDTTSNGPRKRFGARSQMQHDNLSEFSEGSDSDSGSSSGGSSFDESSVDESPRRRSPFPRHASRRRFT